MTRYPIPIANNTPPTTAEIVPKNWATACEEVLVELPESKAPSATRVIPDNNNSMPFIIVSMDLGMTSNHVYMLYDT